VVFEYRNINHVKELAPGETMDDFKAEVIEKYRRIDARIGVETGARMASMPPAPEIVKKNGRDVGPGECRYCGETFKKREAHAPHCDKGPGGAL
jgi:hypothetical protein